MRMAVIGDSRVRAGSGSQVGGERILIGARQHAGDARDRALEAREEPTRVSHRLHQPVAMQ